MTEVAEDSLRHQTKLMHDAYSSAINNGAFEPHRAHSTLAEHMGGVVVERAEQTKASPRHSKSPKCEAFVMTGEKMLNLNPKISPHYAKMCQNQLPPAVEAAYSASDENGMQKKRGPFDDFPSMHHRNPKLIGPQLPTIDASVEGNGEATRHLVYPEGSMKDLAEEVPSMSLNDSLSTVQHNLSSEAITNGRSEPMAGSSGNSSASKSTPSSPTKHTTAKAYGSHLLLPIRVGSSLSTRSVELLSNPEAMDRLAYRLFSLQAGFKLEDVANFLMRRDQLSECVSQRFMWLFNFSGTRLDAALRDFLQHVSLTGESSQRARILNHFSTRYHECNPSLFNSADEIHALTCSLILLNTDLHGYNSGRKMSCREFVNNLAHTHYSFDRNMLKTLYASVKQTPFQYQTHTLPEHVDRSKQGRGNGTVRLSHVTSMKSSTLLINPEEQVDYKHGWLLRKSVYDQDGKKTPLGRRGWQMFYATVRGMVLYLHKDEKGFEGSRHGCFNNCVLLHHALAEVPRDYNKRQHVFRLRTANFGEQLFQTSEPSEVARWIHALNYVAAAFSTPVLPAPVGSSGGTVTFYKPTLPSAPTTLPLDDQLKSHRERLAEMERRLVELRAEAPSLKAKGQPVYDYFYKERYLDKERERYATYVAILEEKLNTTSHCRSQSLSASVTTRQHAVPPSTGVAIR